MTELSIGILGAGGRMGRALVRAINDAEGCVLLGGVDADTHAGQGKDLGTLAGLEPAGIALTTDTRALVEAADVIIDFTVPAVIERHAALVAETGTSYVVGTTGLEAAQQQAIEAAAETAAVIQAANFSLGVNLALALTRQAAAALGEEFDIEIVEMHHRHKIDAPSGTALALGQAAADGRQVNLDQVADRGRDGITGARKRGDIGFAVLRGGNVAGDHSVVFAADDERIEITHKAADRMIFARGAVQAALWTSGRDPGLYSMQDILGF
ncbi:MAG: 4-hydroxy-tetrahydrodipicolinate reductase [Alphaproteobacteria bacterium]